MAIVKTLIGNIKGPKGDSFQNEFENLDKTGGASVEVGQLKGIYVVVVQESYNYTDEEGNEQGTSVITEIPMIITGNNKASNTVYSINVDNKADNHITVNYYTTGRLVVYTDANNINTIISSVYKLI